MPHSLILSGTGTGREAPRDIAPGQVVNVQQFGIPTLEYVLTDTLAPGPVINEQFWDEYAVVTLVNVVVTNLTLTAGVVNTQTFGTITLENLPFVPENAETATLIAAFDQTYTTTQKLQMDTLISELKDAGVWAKLDWYGNAYWAKSEHDALLDWTNPARSLVKVGSASWSQGVGLNGTTPTSNSRYKSGWNVGDGVHSTATSFAFFSKITAIAVPQNGLQPQGVWQLVGGPATPDGSFLSLSVLANTGFAGANVNNGNGNTSFAPGDGLGVWGVSRDGTAHITVKDGTTLETDTVAGNSTYTDADGMSIAGSAGVARKSFPGTQLYWGWGQALSNTEFAAVEAAFQQALLPPSLVTDALLIDGSDNYLEIDGDGNYLKVL